MYVCMYVCMYMYIYIYIYSGRRITSRHENLGAVLIGSENMFLDKKKSWASPRLLRLCHITSGSEELGFASGDLYIITKNGFPEASCIR